MNCIHELKQLVEFVHRGADKAEIAMNKNAKATARLEFCTLHANLKRISEALAECENPPKPGGPNGFIGCVGKIKGWPISQLECARGCTNAGHGCHAWQERTSAIVPQIMDAYPSRSKLIEQLEEQALTIRTLRNQLDANAKLLARFS